MPKGKQDGPRVHQSNSAIETYINCGWQYYFRYIKGVKRAPSIAMIQGGAFSDASEVNFKQKVESGNDLKLSVLEDVLMESLDGKILEREKDILETGVKPEEEQKGVGEIREETRTALGAFHERVCKNIYPIEAEYELRVPIESFNVQGGKSKEILLYMDLLAHPYDPLTGKKLSTRKGACIILDNKLTGKTPNKDNAQKSQQLSLYAWALSVVKKRFPITTGLIYTVKKAKPEIVVQLAKKNPEDAEVYRLRMAEVLKAIEHEIWIPADPSSWKCSEKHCGYWGICPVRPRIR